MLYTPKIRATLATGILFTRLAFLPSVASLSTHQIFQFPVGTWIESIAVRSNSHLLLNSLSSATIYSLDPTATSPSASPLVTIPNANGLAGIAEIARDVFAVSAATWNLTSLSTTPDSTSVWTVDLRGGGGKALTRKVADIKGNVAFNGMTAFPGSPGVVLVADSLGKVWRVDTRTGKHQIVNQDQRLAPNSAFPLGINGLHVRGQELYFTNSAQGFFGKVLITSTGEAAGDIEIIAELPEGFLAFDDFAQDKEGRAWITMHVNGVAELGAGGKELTILGGGNSTVFLHPTSAAFGRGNGAQEKVLYVSTGGGETGGGQVVAIDTC